MSEQLQSKRDGLSGEKFAITNVRIFDGRELREPTTVVIESGVIGTDATGATKIDAGGATLLPGLIDAHIHVRDEGTLWQLAAYGVTTGLDMAAWPPALVDSLRNRPGLTDIRSAGIPATSAGSAHSCLPHFPAQGLVNSPDAAAQFVADRVAEGVDYIKLVADIPGPDQETLDALVIAAHQQGKITVAHAVSTPSVQMAVAARCDMITHAPLDAVLDEAAAARIAEQGCIFIPTLSMMKGIADRFDSLGASPGGVPAGGPDYEAARSSVAVLHRAGVPILAGTDANSDPHVPFSPPHGLSLHEEFELLIEAGLSTVEVLRAATVLPAKYFALHDRGVIEPGKRADLLLIDGDPVSDIRATRRIERVWIGGIEHVPAAQATS